MKYRLMTENDLEYVVEKNNEYYNNVEGCWTCLLYTSPSPRDSTSSRMPSSA